MIIKEIIEKAGTFLLLFKIIILIKFSRIDDDDDEEEEL